MVLFLAISGLAIAGDSRPDSEDVESARNVASHSENHILGIIPNYQAVEDPNAKVDPLRPSQKWSMFARTTTDPFALVMVGIGAATSQASHGTPDYGTGRAAFGKRLGAAYSDVMLQGMMTGALLPSILHQDPRYFRLGPEYSLPRRVGYALSRVIVTRHDSGKPATNWSFLGGTVAGIAASNLYYPGHSQTGSVLLCRVGSNVLGSAVGNLLPEFWPDIRQHLFHHRQRP